MWGECGVMCYTCDCRNIQRRRIFCMLPNCCLFCKYAKNHMSTLRSTQPPARNDLVFFFDFSPQRWRLTYFWDSQIFIYIICLLCFLWANITESLAHNYYGLHIDESAAVYLKEEQHKDYIYDAHVEYVVKFRKLIFYQYIYEIELNSFSLSHYVTILCVYVNKYSPFEHVIRY